MTSEGRDFLTTAAEHLDDARKIMAIPLPKVAARSAYYAAFHAAEAFIVERTGRVAKTHNGVRAEFARLLKETSAGDRDLLTFLAKAYKFKEVGDYGLNRHLTITDQDASNAIDEAEHFIRRVTAWLNP